MLYIEAEVYHLESAMDRDSVCLFSHFVLFLGTTVCLKAHTSSASHRPPQPILIITMAQNQTPIQLSLLLRRVSFKLYINVMSENQGAPCLWICPIEQKTSKWNSHCLCCNKGKLPALTFTPLGQPISGKTISCLWGNNLHEIGNIHVFHPSRQPSLFAMREQEETLPTLLSSERPCIFCLPP